MDQRIYGHIGALSYIASYADLRAALGADPEAGRRHYLEFGLREGRAISFEALRYLASYPDLAAAFGADAGAGASHYIQFGAAEGRTAAFDALRYIASNADLIAAFGADEEAAARHYLQFGRTEGRTAGFDGLRYLASHPDLIAAFGADPVAATRHYIVFGAAEGRQITFDGLRYLASYPDLAAAYGADEAAATRHFIAFGAHEGRTVSFDALRYLASHPDLIAAFGPDEAAGARHYIQFGRAEGRQITFDPATYLLANPDLADTGAARDAAALTRHWVAEGAPAGRSATGAFGSEQADHALPAGGYVIAALEQAGDQDWYRLALAGGQAITLDLTLLGAAPLGGAGGNIPGGGTGALAILDAGGTVLARSAPDAARIDFTAPAAGTYYVTLFDPADAAGGYILFAGKVVTGTDGNDQIFGTQAAELIRGLGTWDLLEGGDGDNILEGGASGDSLRGGAGNDLLFGNNAANSGDDRPGLDYLTDYSGGDDRLYGQDGDDTLEVRRFLTGPASTVLLDGGDGDDTIRFTGAGAYRDTLTVFGGTGHDRITIGTVRLAAIEAGAGDDEVTLTTSGGEYRVSLGAGADVLRLAEGSAAQPGAIIRLADFTPGADRLDADGYLVRTLLDWDGRANPFGTGHLRLVQRGGDAVLEYDRDGEAGGAYQLAALVTFADTLAADLTMLELGYTPDGSVMAPRLVDGTAGADTITGLGGPDLIRGLAGNDVLHGRGGDDLLEGGPGIDRLDGGYGDDVLYGNNAQNSGDDPFGDHLYDQDGGNDRLYGQDGNDTLEVRRYAHPASTVLLDGGAGDDRISFIASNRHLDDVTISGGAGRDMIDTGTVRTAVIDAGEDDDVVTLNLVGGTHTVTLGTGADVLKFTSTSYGSTPTGTVRITDFVSGGDRLELDRYLNQGTIGWSGATNPFASGFLRLTRAGADTLLELDRDGSAKGNYGFVTLAVLENTAQVTFTKADFGGHAPDGSVMGETFVGTAGDDRLTGTLGDDLIQGLAGDDVLDGRAGNDIIEGGRGADTLSGGFGDDVLYGNSAEGGDDDDARDILYDNTGGNDRLYGQGGDDNLRISRSDSVPGTVLLDGGGGDDAIGYNAGPGFKDEVTILGGAGNDIIDASRALSLAIDAGDGDDTIYIGVVDGEQTLSLGAGADTVILWPSWYSYELAATTRITDFTPGADRIDLADYLAYTLLGWDASSSPFDTGHLRLVQQGADAVLEVDRDGAGGAHAFAALLTFADLDAAGFQAGDFNHVPAPEETGAAFEGSGPDAGLPAFAPAIMGGSIDGGFSAHQVDWFAP